MAGFKISESVSTVLLCSVIVGVVAGVVTNQSRLAVVEDRSKRLDKILEHVAAIATEQGVHSQALNSTLHIVNMFNDRVNDIEDHQSRNTERAAQHHEMYAVKGSQVDSNTKAIHALRKDFMDSILSRKGGGRP